MLSYWDILPCDVQNNIKDIVAAQTIQSNWLGHHCRNKIAITTVKKYTDRAQLTSTPYIDIKYLCKHDRKYLCYCDRTVLRTVLEIEYCVNRVLSNRFMITKCELDLWKSFIRNIEFSHWDPCLPRAPKNPHFYGRIERAKNKLQKHLDLCIFITEYRQNCIKYQNE
jgi:hypothetical protein